MPQQFFQFKQFKVHQELAAMKVCTDGCLFGAWVAHLFEGRHIERMLDIGAGTGLLSLMIAQKTTGTIEAIEIDEEAALQSKMNFEASIWHDRLNIINADAREWLSDQSYDLIFSNPPFFEKDLKSERANRNVALHSSYLLFSDLLKIIAQHLSNTGCFAILLPYHRSEAFIKLAEENNFFVAKRIDVKQTENHNYFRSMLLLSRIKKAPEQQEMAIKIGDQYSRQFQSLLKDYYLRL